MFVADWGSLSSPPCYVAAVHNMKSVARCLAEYLTFLRDSGLKIDKTTCVGHSLGAHICGLMSNFMKFRAERIIGLDPARPLVKPGSMNRLDSGDAKAVHVIHTNAGYYGETGKVGHVDFCINGGKHQPYCQYTSSKLDFEVSCNTLLISLLFQIQIFVVTSGQYVTCLKVSSKESSLMPNLAREDVHQA